MKLGKLGVFCFADGMPAPKSVLLSSLVCVSGAFGAGARSAVHAASSSAAARTAVSVGSRRNRMGKKVEAEVLRPSVGAARANGRNRV